MYLKSIEVQGFKSFANKISFQFHNGITAIVGPNGSGKSNVADAVRWVLGEQSAKSLRGGSMQDVIFAGTESRRPLSYACVAITLDNSDHSLDTDYEEVTVARRLYRSGESEYLMNGAVCRLRDVNELFYDTGIGKEGYSIIGQGQIDRILSSRPEETRELFDEATGIVKFKRRKNEAQKKLDEERQDIVRINDIISELERQSGPLERQAAKAKEYLRKKEELKSYDVNLFLIESKRLDAELEACAEKADLVSGELKEAADSDAELKGRYDRAENELAEYDAKLEETRNAINSLSLMRQSAASDIELLKEQINSAQAGAGRIEERLVSIEKSLREKQESKDGLLREKEALDRELEDVSGLSGAADERQRSIKDNADALSRESAQVSAKLISLINQRASSKGKIQRLDATKEQLEIRKAELDEQLEESKRLEAEKSRICEKYQSEFADICDEIFELTEKRDAQEKAYAEYRVTLGRLNTEIESRQTAYHREASRLESLRNMTERYEGFGNAIQRVMEQKGRIPGIHGVAADLIKTEARYETAIETALGGSIRNIVTEDEETAKKLIAFLKKNRYGRATFLPLDSVHPRRDAVKPEVLAEKGVIGTADSLVETDGRYKDVAGYLLGRVIVAENVDAAVRIAGKYGHSLHIVTPDGEDLRPGGSITGGAYKNSENLLGRRRELKELEAGVKKLEEDLNSSRRRMEAVKEERRKCREQAGSLDADIQECFIKQNTAKLNVDRAGAELEELHGNLENLEKNIEAFGEQLEGIGHSQEELEHELGRFSGGERELKERQQEIQAKLDLMKADEAAAVREAEEIHLREAGLKQKVGFLEENIDRLDKESEELISEKAGLKQEASESGDDVRQKEERIRELMSQSAGYSGREEELKEEEEKLKVKRDEVSAGRRAVVDEREELMKKQTLLDRELVRLNSSKEKLDEKLTELTDYMWDEYELAYSNALAFKNDEYTDAAFLKKMTSSLREDIRKLGDVNVNAIEDYKNISERLGFMRGQRDDLEKARAALEDIISELDTGMRRRFNTEFARIREEFDKAFRELFGGGKGTLELDEETDALEAGIRIIAQPPGKKLQNMMQLSGGEKALTAIALLFAIQNMKPSPFCLLDEIEAALDDSNVGRFTGYLHKLTKNTQFIIITHRKGTMEAADRLYGITMQEKGVSTLVSVNLIEDELDA